MISSEDDALIRFAIANRRLIRFTMHGRVRIAEPHDYGIRDEVPQLLVYQVGGESNSGKLPNWRWVLLPKASSFELLEETFSGGRIAPSGQHSRWQRLFARVEPGVFR
jgi:hypothetical protein